MLRPPRITTKLPRNEWKTYGMYFLAVDGFNMGTHGPQQLGPGFNSDCATHDNEENETSVGQTRVRADH
jgi:hypothetical protein